jgi:hypothetical protein
VNVTDPPYVDGVPEVATLSDGVGSTVNATPLLHPPIVVTTTLPVEAPVGTTAMIDALLQLVIEVAAVPLNFTVLVLCVAPKFVPVIVTEAPTAPEVGDRLVIVGGAVTVITMLCVDSCT